MVILIVFLTFVAFILIDLGLRFVLKRVDTAKRRKDRQEALDIGLRTDLAREATSLKSVQVDEPRARVLAVDDEPIVLDSFRKILVLAGYSVDTVESGPEAIGLVPDSSYDFVFTDLKMPEVSGLEVTKTVKQLRPDIDVVIITGYASVESAVEAMKFGAMDYVEKPFTEDELVDFVNKLVIRRQARVEHELPPKVNVVTPSSPEMDSEHVFNVPSGIFISPAHVWLRIEMSGEVRTGMDDFSRKTIGAIDEIIPPVLGWVVKAGEALFSIKQNTRTMTFPSPISGRVTGVNQDLVHHPADITVNPYQLGWICRMEPEDLPQELEPLRIGAGATAWYREEIDRLVHLIHASNGDADETEETHETMSDEAWTAFSSAFLRA